MRRVGSAVLSTKNMDKEPEHNPRPDQAAGPQPMPDKQAEVMQQIRKALLLDAGLKLEDERRGGFDPYNSRVTSASGQWRVRRRD
jgi:hypothetical protein